MLLPYLATLSNRLISEFEKSMQQYLFSSAHKNNIAY